MQRNRLRRQHPHFVTDSPTTLKHENASCHVLISAEGPSGMREMVSGGEGTTAMQDVWQFPAAGGQFHVARMGEEKGV